MHQLKSKIIYMQRLANTYYIHAITSYLLLVEKYYESLPVFNTELF